MAAKTIPNPVVINHVPRTLTQTSVTAQILVHYLMFVILLLAAIQMDPKREYRNYMVFTYAVTSWYVLQISRCMQHYQEKSITPFYLSLIPFFIVCAISRELHMLVCALWYVSFLIIYLQAGRTNIKKHLIGYSLAFLTCYGLCVCFMSTIYTKNCDNLFCGAALVPEISLAFEVLWIIACLMVVGCFLTLESFIQQNAKTLVERDSFVQTLLMTNVELKTQLKRNLGKNAELDAPLTRVIQILKEIRDSGETDAETTQSLDMVIKVLTSTDLFNVDVHKNAADSDVADFINSLMQKGGGTIVDPGINLLSSRRRGSPANQGVNPVSQKAAVLSVVKDSANIKESISGYQNGDNNSSHALKVIQTYVPKSITSMPNDQLMEINECLLGLDTPDFDVIELDKLTNGHPVYFTGMHLFEKYALAQEMNIDVRVWENFIIVVESAYLNTNTYHNACHAADVTASMHYYLTRARLQNRIPTEDQFAAIVAALIHDLAHPGFNNPFLVNTNDQMALQYNDQSVLEHFHCAMAFNIMRSSPSFDVLANMSLDQQKAIRDIIVTLVLATDMAMHFELITKFKNRLEAFHPTTTNVVSTASTTLSTTTPALPQSSISEQGNVLFGFDMEKRIDRKFVLSIAMKCADINNPSKPLHLSQKWTGFIMEEFFKQGDEERSRGMELSTLMDRYNTDVPKCQVGFIDFVVAPLFDVWSKFMEEDIRLLINNIANNKQYWKTKMSEPAPQPQGQAHVLTSNVSTEANHLPQPNIRKPAPTN